MRVYHDNEGLVCLEDTTMKIQHVEKCRDCSGTGLFRWMAESAPFAVICYKCKGTGAFQFVHEYEPFTQREKKPGVLQVLQSNPGIAVGIGNGHTISDFGGISHADWEAGKPFPPGSEMRKFTCPAWWYQTVDYDRKPKWEECGLGAFCKCKHFESRDLCWARFDAEGK